MPPRSGTASRDTALKNAALPDSCRQPRTDFSTINGLATALELGHAEDTGTIKVILFYYGIVLLLQAQP